MVNLSQKQTNKAKNIKAIYPLSPMQKGMLFHALYEPNSGAYCEQLIVKFDGQLNQAAFKKSWQAVIERYDILRTVFIWKTQEQPLQVVREDVTLPWQTYDWRELSLDEQEKQINLLLEKDKSQEFFLNKAPLMRCYLIQTAEKKFQFIWSYHHILLDGWCQPLIWQDIFQFYQAFSQGENLYLTPPLPYRNYINWLQKQDHQTAKTFWENNLKGLESPTLIEIDQTFQPSTENNSNYQESFRTLGKNLTHQLQQVCRESHLTLNTIFQGIWALLLSRYTGESDIIFGATVSGRSPELTGVESMVGLFINTLPVRLKIDENQSFISWLKEVGKEQVEREIYSYSSLIDIQEWSDIPRNFPLFQSIVVFENYPLDRSSLPKMGDVQIEEFQEFEQNNYPLTLTIIPGDNLEINLSYNPNYFSQPTIEKILDHLEILLTTIPDNLFQPINQVSLLTKQEKKQLLIDWNNTQVDYPQHTLIHQLFETQVKETPTATAIEFQGETLTYYQLNEKANCLAAYLQELGVKSNVLVGICLERSPEMVIGLLAILKAGGAYIPIDPVYPLDRIHYMLEDSQAPVLLTQKSLLFQFTNYQGKRVCLEDIFSKNAQQFTLTKWAQSQNNIISSFQAKNLHSTDLAYVIYTSGSTGKPKGVKISHQSVVNFLLAMRKKPGLSAQDKLLAVTTLSFDIAALEVYLPLIVGAKIILASRDVAADGQQLKTLLNESQATVMQATPATWRLLLAAKWTGNPNLKILSGGEALSTNLANQLTTKAKSVWNVYGPTEATIWSTCYQVKKEEKGSISIGRPIDNTTVYVLDSYLQLVPVGVIGELYLGGESLAKGYLNRPELTAEKFIKNPFIPSQKLYKTGDLVRYRPDGNLDYLGRTDHQVKVRGFRIELTEIETVISQYPVIEQGVVTVREDSSETQQLVAYLLGNITEKTLHKLRQYLQEKLPSYMIPNRFLLLEELPLTPNGKINRRALPVPDTKEFNDSDDLVKPQNPTQEIIASIWSKVLNLEVISIKHNFFELGGHSLLATQVISRVREIFALDIPLKSLFEAPTIEQFSQIIATTYQDDIVEIPDLIKVSRPEQIPLSFAQQRLWFLTQLEGASSAYHMPGVIYLKGQINHKALEESLNQIISRHEVLRTTFQPLNGEAIQVIHPEEKVKLNIIDVRNQDQQTIETIIDHEIEKPFNLEKDSLIRVSLIQLRETENILVVTMHHIIADAWSIKILIKELSAYYECFLDNKPCHLPELPIQYADFAIWQRSNIEKDVISQQLAYWKQQLKGIPSLLQLPTDHPRPPLQSFKGAYQKFVISSNLKQKLTQLTQQNGMTLYMTFLAAWTVLMSRYSQEEDVVIGSPIANRNRTEIEPLIGFFVNTLTLRIDLSNNPSFTQLLKQVRQVCLEAYHHQDISFEKIVEELQPERNLSNNPIFQVMFDWGTEEDDQLQLPGLNLEVIERENSIAKFDLTLSMTDTNEQIMGEIEYSSDLFEPSTIKRMVEHFQVLLQAIIDKPEQAIKQLNILGEAESKQLLFNWNNDQIDYPKNLSIHQLFEAQVSKNPEAVALVFQGKKLTYQQLNQRANQLAYYLQQFNLKSNSLVGVCLERSLEMVIAILAILKAGYAYIPLDPLYPQERLDYMISNAELSALITNQCLTDKLNKQDCPIICLDIEKEQILQQGETNLNQPVNPENLAYIIYTSGSTGKPKGVIIPHKNLVNAYYAWENTYQLSTHCHSHLQMANFSFDVFSGDLVRSLCSGGKLVLCPRETLLEPEALYQLMKDEKIDTAEFVPAVLRALVEYLETKNFRLDFMKLLVVGSDSWYVKEHEKVKALCGQKTRFINSYGVSEATIDSSYFEQTKLDLNQEKLTPIGRPFPNTKLYVLDTALQLVPVGVPGELYISSIGLAQGYLNRPDLTEERFIQNPFDSSEKLYKTGDLVRYLADGNLEFLGRIDNQIKLRGFRIELGEIEAILYKHSLVKEAVVLVREDQPNNQQLVAYVTCHQALENLPNNLITILRNYVKDQLPHYMVPNYFLLLETLPLTPNGKISRRKLPIPDYSLSQETNEIISPETPMQEMVASVWSTVLKIESISIHSNFFELGGHSLLATKVISKIRDNLKVEIPLKSLFENPTIQTLSQALEAISEQPTSVNLLPIKPSYRPSLIPLSFSQERLWFLEQLEGKNSAYTMTGALQLTGSLNLEALEKSINTIISRHEILRTSFVVQNDKPTQVINANADDLYIQIRVLEIESDTDIQTLIDEEAVKPFDLSQDSLIRVSLIPLQKDENILVVAMHHIISDAWSIELFIRELSTYYQHYCQGEKLSFPPLKIQYADYAIWQRQWLETELFEQQLSYWKEQLKNALTCLNLPLDNPRPQKQSYEGNISQFNLSSQLTEQVKGLCQREGATLFMTLLTAFSALLYCYSEDEDICVGSPIANRQRQETQDLIGFFINTLVLRTNCSDNPTFRELLSRVKTMAINAYSHQEVPFEKIVETLKVERDLSYNPLFQVWFVIDDEEFSELVLPDLTWKMKDVNYNSVRHDLSLRLSENEGIMNGYFEYKTSLFNQDTIISIQEDFKLVLTAMVNEPDQKLTDIKAIVHQKKEERQAQKEQVLLSNMRQKFNRRKRR